MEPFTKGLLIPLEGQASTITFQYNPRELAGPGGQADYAQLKCAGGEQPFLEFSCGAVPSIRFELAYMRGGNDTAFVMNQVKALQELTKPSVRGAGVNRPPKIKFIFGSFLRETCVAVEALPTFLGEFNPQSLHPYRARVSMLLWRWRDTGGQR